MFHATRSQAAGFLKKHTEKQGQLGVFTQLVRNGLERYIKSKPSERPPPDPDPPLPSKLGKSSTPTVLLNVGNHRLHVVDPQTGAARAIGPEQLRLLSYRWSPDGRFIAGHGYLGNGPFRYDLWVLDVVEGVGRMVTWGNHQDRAPLWVRDGRRLLFTRGKVDGQIFMTLDLKTGTVVKFADFGGTIDHREISPDGKRVAFTPGDRMKGCLYVMDLDTAKIRTLASGLGGAARPSWSPDGTEVAFSNEGPGRATSDIYVARVADGRVRRITDLGTHGRGPVWTPEGSEIMFRIIDEGFDTGRVGIVNRDGTGLRKVGLPPNFRPRGPIRVSPDGSQVAFAIENYNGGQWRFCILNPSAEAPRLIKLTPKGVETLGPPRWRPTSR